jgi:hypothetical protein
MAEIKTDKLRKERPPRKSGILYYLVLGGFLFFLITGLIGAGVTTKYILLVSFLSILGFCIIQLKSIIESFKSEGRALKTAMKVTLILRLVLVLVLIIIIGFLVLVIII